MFLYLITIITVTGISLFSADRRMNKNCEFFLAVMLCLALTIIAGTRLVGYDFPTYKIHFDAVPDITAYKRTDVSIELGYELMVSLYKTFSTSFNGFLLVYAGATMLFAMAACYKYSPYPLLSIGMFFAYSFFFQVMGQMRQPFAILFLYLFLIPLVEKRKYAASIMLILFATIFLHKSCILCLGILALRDRIMKPWQMGILMLVTMAVYILSALLLQIILAVIPDSFYLYDTIVAYTSTKVIQVGFTLGMLERIGMFGVLYFMSYRYGIYQNNSRLRLWVNTYFTGICIYFAFISVAAEFATRGTFFYIYSLFFAAPVLIKELPDKAKKIMYAIVLLWTVYTGAAIIKNQKDAEEYFPYNSTLFE